MKLKIALIFNVFDEIQTLYLTIIICINLSNADQTVVDGEKQVKKLYAKRDFISYTIKNDTYKTLI